MKKQPSNSSRLEETTALLQQAMASLLQNQILFETRMDRRDEEIKQTFAEIDRRFAQVERRLDKIETLLAQMFAELPERVFGFAQAAAKKKPE